MLGGRYVYVTLIALASLSVTAAKLNMNHICGLVNNGLLIASNEACDAYYQCSDGIATLKSCSSGTYFDKESQICVAQEQVNCLVATAIPCDGAKLGTWAAVAGSCTDFYYCGSNGAQRSSCPSGEYFNPTTQQCVWAAEYPCSSSTDSATSDSSVGSDDVSITITLPINLCNFIRNGLFFGSPSSCNGWNKCVNNVAQTGFCPTGYWYNVLKMECDLSPPATCSQLTDDPYLTANSCSVKSTQKAATSCSTYYVCDGSNYQVVECSAGLYYDTVSQTCVSRENARNDCDRCVGVKSSFVNEYSSQNCTGYLYCLNGVKAGEGFCASGYYFDERVGGCVDTTTEPLLGCCNPNYYSSSTTEAAAKTTDSAESSESGESDESGETTESAKTTAAAKTTEAAETTEAAKTTAAAETTEAAKTTEAAETTTVA